MNGHTQAYLGTLAEIIADAGAVKINATSNSTATATVDGGGGTIGVTVQQFTGTAHIGTTTGASVGDGSTIHAVDADITASATNTPSATVQTTAVGLGRSGGVHGDGRGHEHCRGLHRRADRHDKHGGRNASVIATGSASTIDVKASLIAPVKATGSVSRSLSERAAIRTRMRRRPDRPRIHR